MLGRTQRTGRGGHNRAARAAAVVVAFAMFGCSGTSDPSAGPAATTAEPVEQMTSESSAPSTSVSSPAEPAAAPPTTPTVPSPATSATAGSLAVAGHSDEALRALQDRVREVNVVARAAVAKATNECLTPLGFTYVDPLDPTAIIFDGAETDRYPWRPRTTPAPGADVAPGEIGSVAADTLDSAYEDALYGDVIGSWTLDTSNPDVAQPGGQPIGGEVYDGCLPTAERDIVGGGEAQRATRLVDLAYLLGAVPYQATWAVVADDDFARVVDTWAECMASHGVDAEFRSQSNVARFDHPELDAQCLESSGLTELGDQLLPQKRDEVFAELVGDPDAINRELDEILARSNEVLG